MKNSKQKARKLKPMQSIRQNNFTEQYISRFIKKHFNELTNFQLATALKLPLSSLRTRCYQMGLKRMEMEYFTQVQINFLVKHYTSIGDIELAEIYQKKWPKTKGWTKKHIEKKRKYLGLKRTPLQISMIHARNVKKGRFALCPVKAWKTRGQAKEGTIHYWRQSGTGREFPVIKHNGRFIHWGKWAWQKRYGKIPKNMNVCFKDGNQYNLTFKNLELLTNQQLAQKNSKNSSQGLSDGYIAGILTANDAHLRQVVRNNPLLIEAKRKQLILKRTIYEQIKN